MAKPFLERLKKAAVEYLTNPALRQSLREYVDNVKNGADPIEAMHGHLCGVDCWHYMGDCPRCGFPSKEARGGPFYGIYSKGRACPNCGFKPTPQPRV